MKNKCSHSLFGRLTMLEKVSALGLPAISLCNFNSALITVQKLLYSASQYSASHMAPLSFSSHSVPEISQNLLVAFLIYQ